MDRHDRTPWGTEHLGQIPRLGWVDAPSPVVARPELAERLGLGGLYVKRDDALDALYGGSKVRKLDFLLATPPWRDAERWASPGAIGSGHLVALTAAAEKLGRRVEAWMFFEPPRPPVLRNLAFVAGGPTRIHFHPTVVHTHLAAPGLLLGRRVGGAVAIPAGASTPPGTLGMVRGGLELAAQVHAGVLPAPDDLFVPLGSGGTASGIALGLALGGLRTRVHAVATVPRWIGHPVWVNRHLARTRALLAALGCPVPADLEVPAVDVVHGFLGAGYGHPTPEGAAAAEVLAPWPVDEVYGAKALAGLLAAAPALRGRTVLFWLTGHGGALPERPGWREALPPALSRRLAAADAGGGPVWGRRAVLAGAGAALVAGAVVARTRGYDALPAWQGRVLAAWEAEVVAAAAEVILADADGRWPAVGPTPPEIAVRVDAYLRGMPDALLLEVHGLMALLEQGTALTLRTRRFTRLDPAGRGRFLEALRTAAPIASVAYRGIRDLVLLAWWQDPRVWPAIGYPGPLSPVGPEVPRGPTGLPARAGAYARLVAAPGARPRCALPPGTP